MSLLQLVFPKRCYTCDTILRDREFQICSICRHHLPILTQKELQYYLKQFDLKCKDILYFDVLLLFEKHNLVQKLLHNLKYRKYYPIGNLVGKFQIENIIQIHKNTPIDIILPIPIHKKRLYKRGFNQLEGYANAISQALDIKVRNDILFKTKYHRRLAITNYKDRDLQIHDSFELKNPSQLEGKHVLVTDDIVTTGATLNEVIQLLKKEINCKISVACMALTKPED